MTLRAGTHTTGASRGVGRHLARGTVIAGTCAAAALTAHTAWNIRYVRRPLPRPATVTERVSVLLPARDEANRIGPTLRTLMAQEGLADLEILVLDDGSTDGTADVVREVAAGDPRVRVIDGGPLAPPPGWLGKSWACQRLGEQATGTVLVFVDAEVLLHRRALAATVTMMREAGLDLLSPYPRQAAVTVAERITQPLVVWSWLATLPLRIAETKPYPSMAAAVGQFLVVDARAYRVSGGHTAVAGDVIEDVGVLRTLKRHGFRGVPADGGAIASCRMYEGAGEIHSGYTKSLWSAFGSTPGAMVMAGLMIGIYVVPPVAAIASRDRTTRAFGALGYGAGVLGRWLVARQTGERTWPDVLAHPVSMATFAGLVVDSVRRRRAGTLTWRGRPLP